MANFVVYQNAKVHYTDTGKGEAVVLLHGFLENLSIWNDLVPYLTKSYRVICIDLLGHGASEGLNNTHPMHIMSEAVYSVIHSLDLRQIILIGHSMGGYVSLALLEKYSSLIKAVCLINSTAVADTEKRKKQRLKAIRLAKNNSQEFIKLMTSTFFNVESAKQFKNELNSLQFDALKMSPNNIIAAIEGMKNRKDRLKLFQSYRLPKMVILGRKDSIINFKKEQDYYHNTDIQIVELSNGHMSHIENKEGFTYNIMHFIENI